MIMTRTYQLKNLILKKAIKVKDNEKGEMIEFQNQNQKL